MLFILNIGVQLGVFAFCYFNLYMKWENAGSWVIGHSIFIALFAVYLFVFLKMYDENKRSGIPGNYFRLLLYQLLQHMDET